MTTINLGTASWTLAKAKLRLEVAACASLDAPGPLLQNSQDLLATDIWIHRGHDFHLAFHLSFNNLPSESSAVDGDPLAHFIYSVLTQAPVGACQIRVVTSANKSFPAVVTTTTFSFLGCIGPYRRRLPSQGKDPYLETRAG